MPQWELDEAYRRGLQEGYSAGQLDAFYKGRTEQLLRTRDEALRAGLGAFAEGRYDEAADLFILATELDHSDPASRLHAAQALFALEQYEQAVPLIRRALELQPKLLYLKFDLRRDYGDVRDFEEQLHSLSQYLAENPDWQAGYLLLGYELLYSGQRTQAHKILSKAAALNPTDKLVASMLQASTPLPARRVPRMQPSAQPAKGKGKRA